MGEGCGTARMRIEKRIKMERFMLRPVIMRLLMFFWWVSLIREGDGDTSVRSRARTNITSKFGIVEVYC